MKTIYLIPLLPLVLFLSGCAGKNITKRNFPTAQIQNNELARIVFQRDTGMIGGGAAGVLVYDSGGSGVYDANNKLRLDTSNAIGNRRA